MNIIRNIIPLRLRIIIGPYIAYVFYVYRIYIKREKPDFKVLSLLETITRIKNEKLSVIRFGDGEMSAIYNEDLGFQKKNVLLSVRLKEVLQSNITGLLICVPNIWGNINHFSKRSFWFTLHHLFKYNKRWKNILHANQTYGDAFISRPYLNFKNNFTNKKIAGDVFNNMRSIWDNKNVLLIEGSGSRLGVGNNLFSNTKSLKRILCPSENAFNIYNQILEQSDKILHSNNLEDQNKDDELVLISLGPTAKVLAYDLFKLGYRVIDIGHIDMEYEMFLRNSENIVKVEYKYFNEIDARNPEECKDPLYLGQIIARIE